MRKTIFLALALLLTSSSMQAQLCWNRCLEFSMGMSHLFKQQVFEEVGSENYWSKSDKDLWQIDATLFGLYVGMGVASKKSDNEFAGKTRSYKFGPSFAINLKDERMGGNITPYVILNQFKLDTQSQGTWTSQKKKWAGVGAKLSFLYMAWKIEAFASSQDLGMSVGYSFDLIGRLKARKQNK